MKYIGRITLLCFSIMVSIIESFSEEMSVLSIIEALFFGAVAYFIGSLYDKSIYYRKQAEISEERYRHLIQFSPDPIVVHQEGVIVFVNDKLEQLVQSSSENIIGKSIFDYVVPEYHSKITERIRKMDVGVKHMDFKVKVENKILDIESASVSIVYNNKPSVEVFLRDVTERKKLEESSRKNEDLYRFITENSTDIISYIKPDGTYAYMSPSCYELLGYKQDEVINKDLFHFIHPDEVLEISEIFAEAISHIDFASFPHRYRKKDGSFIWLETNARTIRHNNKELEGIVTVSRDISGRVEKEKNLIETNEMLRYLSNYDGLTDIPNRRYFEQTLNEEWNKMLSDSLPLSLLMVDIDNFKKYNDHYGHQAGDWCIKQIAQAIKQTLKKPSDFAARYGGEEFIILLPNTKSEEAARINDSLLSNVRELKIKSEVSNVSNYVTISIGCATVVPNDHINPEELLKLADKELYLAKESGKNQVKQTSLL